jgi:hypothetical protein
MTIYMDSTEMYADVSDIPWEYVKRGMIPRRYCSEGYETLQKFF